MAVEIEGVLSSEAARLLLAPVWMPIGSSVEVESELPSAVRHPTPWRFFRVKSGTVRSGLRSIRNPYWQLKVLLGEP